MPAITSSPSSARSGLGGMSRRKVKLEPFLIFNQQFLTLIRAGLPILGSLQMLTKIQKSAHFRSQLDDVANRVKTGESLSGAFEAQTGIPVMYTTTLLAGERSGNLQEVLERYIGFQRVSLTFRKKLTASLIYPGLLLTIVSGLLVFMFTVVIPQFAQLYDQMGSKLPGIDARPSRPLASGRSTTSSGSRSALVIAARWTLAFLHHREGPRHGRRHSRAHAHLRQDLAQVPGRAVLAYAFHAAHRRPAAGSVA